MVGGKAFARNEYMRLYYFSLLQSLGSFQCFVVGRFCLVPIRGFMDLLYSIALLVLGFMGRVRAK
jgi:hypothetical protein